MTREEQIHVRTGGLPSHLFQAGGTEVENKYPAWGYRGLPLRRRFASVVCMAGPSRANRVGGGLWRHRHAAYRQGRPRSNEITLAAVAVCGFDCLRGDGDTPRARAA